MKQLILSLSLIAFLLSCKKADTTPSNTTPNTNKDTNQTSIAKYGAGVTDIDGNKYKTVIIGSQEWMGENLKVSKYNDGSSIPSVIGVNQWKNLTTGAWCNLLNSDSLGTIYGKLYNWYAVKTNKLCPNGWHVPNYEEWQHLFKTLNANFEANGDDTIVGNMLKETGTKHWDTEKFGANFGTNKSLFTALPAGIFPSDATNAVEGFNIYDTGWYTTSELISDERVFNVGLDGHYIDMSHPKQKFLGLSVRCLKD